MHYQRPSLPINKHQNKNLYSLSWDDSFDFFYIEHGVWMYGIQMVKRVSVNEDKVSLGAAEW